MKRIAGIGALILLTTAAAAQIKVERIRLRVLNGHNGKPIAGVMSVTTVYPLISYRYPIDARTDAQGNASVLVPTDTEVSTLLRGHPTCLPGGGATGARKGGKTPTAFPVPAILSAGVVEQNRCGHREVQAAPGELVIFVRNRRWWERFTY